MNDVRSSPRRLPSYSYSYSNSNCNSYCSAKPSLAKRLAVFGSHTLCLYSVYMHTFISLLVAWGPRQVSMTHAYSINVQPIINMHMHQAHPPPLPLSAIPLLSTSKIPLTLLKVVSFAHIYTDQGHQLQLRQSLSR